MKKKSPNRYFHIGLTIFLSLGSCILLVYLLFYGKSFRSVVKNIFQVFHPILLGIAIAYILNPVMNFIENKVFFKLWNKFKKPEKEHKNEKRIARGVSVILTTGLFLLMLYGLFRLIVPQVISSIESLIYRVPQYIRYVNKWFSGVLTDNPMVKDLIDQYWINVQDWFSSSFVPMIQDSISSFSTGIVGSVIVVFKGVLNFIIGLIISIYLLSSKETFLAQAKKVFYAFMKEEKANNLINNIRYSNKIFGGFISGKIIDSIIIGILCYIGMMIMGMPYAVLISVFVGVTNVIPYVGPFIGALPSAFILLMVSPIKCLTFLIFVLVLQQFDGNVLGPKILGDSTGLSSFWVLFSITIFGSMFGMLGMFLGVPIFAIIYAAIRTMVNTRLQKKNLPTLTSYYKQYDLERGGSSIATNMGTEIKFGRNAFEHVIPEQEESDELQGIAETKEIDDKDTKDTQESKDSKESKEESPV